MAEEFVVEVGTNEIEWRHCYCLRETVVKTLEVGGEKQEKRAILSVPRSKNFVIVVC